MVFEVRFAFYFRLHVSIELGQSEHVYLAVAPCNRKTKQSLTTVNDTIRPVSKKQSHLPVTTRTIIIALILTFFGPEQKDTVSFYDVQLIGLYRLVEDLPLRHAICGRIKIETLWSNFKRLINDYINTSGIQKSLFNVR